MKLPWYFRLPIPALVGAVGLIVLSLPLKFIFGVDVFAGPAGELVLLAIPVLLAIGLAAAIFASFYDVRLESRRAEQARAIGTAMLMALGEQRWDEAHGLLADSARARLTPARLADLASGNRYIETVQSVTLSSYVAMADTAVLGGSLGTSEGDVGLEVHLVQADSDWRVTGVALAGTPLLG